MTKKVMTDRTLLEVKGALEELGYPIVRVRQQLVKPHVLEIEFDVE